MQPKKGDLITLEDNTKFVIVETLIEDENIYHCIVSEDGAITVFVQEEVNEKGQSSMAAVIDEEKQIELAQKFDAIMNNN